MKIRALVAKADGAPDRNGNAFARGSITTTTDVPVTRNFDPRLPPLGRATITVEANGDVYAEMDLRDDVTADGLFPALGGLAAASVFTGGLEPPDDVAVCLKNFTAHEISLCDSPNTDQRIPIIGVKCEACDSGFRLAPDGVHYDDARGGWTWGVCRKVVDRIRREREQAHQK